MRIVIIDDEPLVANALKELIEADERHRVTGVFTGWRDARDLIEADAPDLVMLDINLSSGSSGYALAGVLNHLGIPCLFAAALPPPFPMPELAIGCLCKPFNRASVETGLSVAESIIKGHRIDFQIMLELEIY